MATVEEGRDNVAKLLVAGEDGDEYDSVAIGDSDEAVEDSDSELVSTVDTDTGLTGSVDGNTATLVGTFTGNSADIREASIYNESSDNMLARQVIDTVNVEDSDTLEITWEIEVQDA